MMGKNRTNFLRKGIEDYLSGEYMYRPTINGEIIRVRGSSKYDRCADGEYFYKGCSECDNRYFEDLLKRVDVGKMMNNEG